MKKLSFVILLLFSYTIGYSQVELETYELDESDSVSTLVIATEAFRNPQEPTQEESISVDKSVHMFVFYTGITLELDSSSVNYYSLGLHMFGIQELDCLVERVSTIEIVLDSGEVVVGTMMTSTNSEDDKLTGIFWLVDKSEIFSLKRDSIMLSNVTNLTNYGVQKIRVNGAEKSYDILVKPTKKWIISEHIKLIKSYLKD